MDIRRGSGVKEFKNLSDTPSSYTGQSGKTVTVKATEDMLEFTTPAGGGDMLVATYDPASKNEQLLGISDIQTTVGNPGSDSKIPSEQGTREALNVIDQKKVKATNFATIAAGTTSGTITKPAGAGADVDFIMDEWGTATDALVSTIENGKPTFKSPVDASGNTITTTFNTAGNYAFSATPSPVASHAVIYVYTCYFKGFNVAETLWETELLDYVNSHKDTHDPQDGSDALDCAVVGEIVGVTAASEGSAHSLARADHIHQIQHSVADNHIVTIDHATVIDNDYAKFTSSGLEGRSKAEMLSDLNVVDGATKYPDTGEQAFLDADHTKLNAIEAGADVTDATNVNAAGAVMTTDTVNVLSDITSTGANIEDAVTKKHAATLIGTKTIDETDIANTKVIAYNSTSGNLEYEPAGTPDAHAATHITGGGDTIANAVAAGNAGLMTGADKTKLNGIEAAADITDVTNVNAAGAVMESDYNANTFLYAVSDDTPVVKTRAETLALLSGQADASFDMNSRAITKLSNVVTTHTPGAAGTATLDLDIARIHDITMPAGNITIAVSNENNGDIFTIRILQDGTGSRMVTWFSTIKWAGGSAPTLTTTANKADTVIFRVTGTDTYDGFVVGQNI